MSLPTVWLLLGDNAEGFAVKLPKTTIRSSTYPLYRSGLVPRAIPMLGLIGALLLAASKLLRGVWMTFRGFNV